MNIVSVLRSSEFWVAVVSAILSILVKQGVLPQSVADFVINVALPYILFRLTGKVAKALVKPAA